MPHCANCDEWFEGTRKDKTECEHCRQLNPLDIIENQDQDPETWVCRDYFEIQRDLFHFKAAMMMPVIGAAAAKTYFGLHILGYVLIAVAVVLMLLAWGLKWTLVVASQDGETHLFRMITCYGYVLSQKERAPEKMGPVIVQKVKSIDPDSGASTDRRLIRIDGFTVTGFGSRDGGMRFARILADHCGLNVKRVLGG